MCIIREMPGYRHVASVHLPPNIASQSQAMMWADAHSNTFGRSRQRLLLALFLAAPLEALVHILGWSPA